jgi:hypothetical protein
VETDLAVVSGIERRGEFADGCDDGSKLLVVGADSRIKFGEFFGESFVIGDRSAQTYEGSDDEDAHLDSSWAIQDVGGHQGSVFDKGIRKRAAPTAARS